MEYAQGDFAGYVEGINSAMREQKEKSWTNKLAQLMEPIFITARRYMPVANIAIQADPSPSALVLAGIVCIMQISSGYLLYQEQLATVLSRMGQKADTLTRLGDHVYPDDGRVQQALIDAYGDILDFCKEALKPLVNERGRKRTNLKFLGASLLKPFEDSNFGKIERNFEKHLEIFKDISKVSTRMAEATYRAEQRNLTQNVLYMLHQNQQNISMSHGTASELHQLQIEEVGKQERKAQG